MRDIQKQVKFGVLGSALLLGACSYLPGQGPVGYHGSHYGHPTQHCTTNCVVKPKTTYAPPPKTYTYHATPAPKYAPTYKHHYSAPAPKYHYKGGHGHYAHGPVQRPYGMRGYFQPYKYGSLGATVYDLESGNIGAQARLGYQFTPMFAAEAEGSLGLIDDVTTVGATTSETDIGSQIAAFGVARYPVSDKLTLLGRVGYHTTDIETSETTGAVTTTVNRDDDGLAFGGGAEFKLNPRDALRLDYTVYSLAGSDLDSLAVGYQRKF